LSICFLVLLEDQELYESTCRLKCTLLNTLDEEIEPMEAPKIEGLYSIEYIQWNPRNNFYSSFLGQYWRFDKFILRHILLNPTNRLVENDELRIKCEIFLFPKNTRTSAECSSKFSSDIAFLHENEDFSDIVFDVDGQIFRAHRNILSARSPVFRWALLFKILGLITK